MTPVRTHAAFPVTVALLCALGTTVSVLSTLDHLGFKASGGDAGGFCAALVDTGCASAHSSAAAEVFGIPISLFGVAWYVAAAALALATWNSTVRERRRREGLAGGRRAAALDVVLWVPAALFVGGVGSLGYSAWLASVLLRLGQMCPFCATLYGVNVGLTATCAAWGWPGLRRPAEALRGVIRPLVAAGVLAGAVLAVALPLYFAAVRASPAPVVRPAGVQVPPDRPVLPDRVPLRGSPVAAATLVEFSDLECPFCETMHTTISQLIARRADRLNVRFVHYPLDTACNCHVSVCVHQTACLAARGAICAQREGRFWEFADLCYRDRRRHARDDLVGLAREAGIDPLRFQACLDSPDTAKALAEDIELAWEMGVRATPTIVLNDTRFEGAIDLPRLEELLDRTAECNCDPGASVCACDRGKSDCACGTPIVPEGACGTPSPVNPQ